MRNVKPVSPIASSTRSTSPKHSPTSPRRTVVNDAGGPPEPQLRDLIGYRIRRLNMLLTQHGKLFSRRTLGLTQAQWRILVELGARGATNPKLVAEYTGLERSHVTQAVRVLEQRRFVSRSPDGSDGRRILVSLTANGRALLSRGIDAYADRRKRLADALSDAERCALDSALVKLIATAERILSEHIAEHGGRARP